MLALIGYSAADLLVRWLPLPAVQALAVGLARAAFALPLPARRSVMRNLERLGDASGERRARAAFEHFARSIVDFLRLESMDAAALQQAIEVRGAEHLAMAELNAVLPALARRGDIVVDGPIREDASFSTRVRGGHFQPST